MKSHILSTHAELRNAIMDVLTEVIRGRSILLYGQATGSRIAHQYFHDAGAYRVLDLPTRRPTSNECISARFQLQNDELLRPSDTLRRHLSKVDPRCQAVVFAGSSVTAEALDGRPVIGRRLPNWRECEKKRYQSELTKFQGTYVPQYIDFLADLGADDLLQLLEERLPCVVAGDPKDCIGMGADYVYVLQENTNAATRANISRLMYEQCEGVRVAPLSHGMPATFYGIVSGDSRVLYGPVEALVGFHAIQRKVVAPGILIPVDTSQEIAYDASVSIARLVDTVVTTTGFCGAFGIDGCLTSEGMVIHEINTRVCAGFSLLSRLHGVDIPFGIIDLIIRETAPGRCSRLLALLAEPSESLCHRVDLRLWEDLAREGALRQSMPGSGANGNVDKWKAMVRSTVLAGYVPLYDGSLR